MDELVRVFHGGMVKETGEFDNMVEDIELFDSPPLSDLYACTSRVSVCML